ncbi:MFS multidrug transporter-like protein [Dothidotthia symphoricarpi CBS 119687]|uniref:MFS multidrug transporter-like protein n=1 Tax=Dothidotthia symphoricarpi CBS 119687 TaxID=1392245 RepID=A0A6A6ASE4_9PLEO|nr:MFS multidrug transporter-like protein [Dothidotthia symphoricarpi CBS 119687]KAF2133451.1 MFS multidrug transporter-like protein [Dothidotthia symphoricarpi CBS 119687]
MCLLNKRRTNTRDASDDNFPAAQLFLLALVRVAEPIALTSLFPYAWKLVLNFHVCSESNAPFFAGILIAAFSLAEACSSMYWGAVSDRVGRKPVVILGCLGTVLSLLIVGLAPNFWVALAGRILGGALNGNIGVIQTIVGELVTRPEHEPRAYSVMPFVWSIGTIIGPSIGGYFAEPAQNFPSFFNPTGPFATFPYLLPNLICASLLVVSIIMAYFLLEESHPDRRPQVSTGDGERHTAATPLFPTQGATADAGADLTTESYGTFNAVEVRRDEVWHVRSNGEWVESSVNEKAFTPAVVMFVVALGIFTYHSMTFDHLLPIFLQDKRAENEVNTLDLSLSSLGGGLGMPIQTVGIILSVNGVIQLAIQAFVFPLLAKFLGVWRLLLLVTVFHPLAYFAVPFLQLLPTNMVFISLFCCLVIRSITSILAFPLLLIMIKEAAPDKSHLGKINGLAAATGAACRTVASPIAGLLYGLSIEIHFTPLAWWASALVAVIGALQIPFLTRASNQHHAQVHTAAHRYSSSDRRGDEVVHITVQDEA